MVHEDLYITHYVTPLRGCSFGSEALLSFRREHIHFVNPQWCAAAAFSRATNITNLHLFNLSRKTILVFSTQRSRQSCSELPLIPHIVSCCLPPVSRYLVKPISASCSDDEHSRFCNNSLNTSNRYYCNWNHYCSSYDYNGHWIKNTCSIVIFDASSATVRYRTWYSTRYCT